MYNRKLNIFDCIFWILSRGDFISIRVSLNERIQSLIHALIEIKSMLLSDALNGNSGAIVRIEPTILFKDTIKFELITMIKRDFSYYLIFLVWIFFNHMNFSRPIGLFPSWSLLRPDWLFNTIVLHTFVRLLSVYFFGSISNHILSFQSNLTTCPLSLILMILKDWVKWEKVWKYEYYFYVRFILYQERMVLYIKCVIDQHHRFMH